jgi:hypothetical protein
MLVKDRLLLMALQLIQVPQQVLHQEPMMIGEVSLQRQLQLGDLAAQYPLGHLGQGPRVPFAADQGPQHRPPRLPQDVGGHRTQLDVRVLQDLVDAVGQPRLLARQLRAEPSQVA